MVLGGGRLKCDCCCTLRGTYVWVPAAADWQGAHETETVEEGEVALRLLSRRERTASLLRRFVDVVWLRVCVAMVLGCGACDVWFVSFRCVVLCCVGLCWVVLSCSGVE